MQLHQTWSKTDHKKSYRKPRRRCKLDTNCVTNTYCIAAFQFNLVKFSSVPWLSFVIAFHIRHYLIGRCWLLWGLFKFTWICCGNVIDRASKRWSKGQTKSWHSTRRKPKTQNKDIMAQKQQKDSKLTKGIKQKEN